jgi:hypothetical protein
MEEKQDFFIQAGRIDNEDELLDELNELEAEMAEDELAQLELGSGPLKGGPDPVKQPAAKAKV